jgi:hypothetical protein
MTTTPPHSYVPDGPVEVVAQGTRCPLRRDVCPWEGSVGPTAPGPIAAASCMPKITACCKSSQRVVKEVDVMSMVDTRQAARAPGTPGTMSGRLAAVSFVLILISATMLSNARSATDSGQKILSYLALHHGRLQLGAVLTALAMSTALVWAAGL